MSGDLKLGYVITDENAARDAIHIAVAPVYSDYHLAPGEHVALVEGSSDKVTSSTDKPIGIVDPYIGYTVKPGQKFWLFLYPNTVTGLRHDWSHPAFPAVSADADARISAKEEAWDWITDFAQRMEFRTGKELIEYANEWLKQGASGTIYASDNDQGYHNVSSLEWAEFWPRWETVTGKISGQTEPISFRCSC